MKVDRPWASIVLTLGDRRERARRTIHTLVSQEGIGEVEILIADASSQGTCVMKDFPALRTAILPTGPCQHLGQMRAAACRTAQGRVIAFLEDHVQLEPGWLMAMKRAFEAGHAAVGPSVANANPGVGVSDTVHLLHYGMWTPPVKPGVQPLIAGNNSAYLAEVLGQLGPDLPGLLLTDTVLQAKLMEMGIGLYLEPEMRIRHLNATRLGDAIRSEYLYHRCFAYRRAREFEWGAWKRILQAVRSVGSPLVRLIRIARIGPAQGREAPGSRPQGWAISILLLAMTAGNLVGLVLHDRQAALQFTHFELNYPRPTR